MWACDVRAAELDATRAAVEAVAAGSCRAGVVDVRDAAAVAAFVAGVLESTGRIDVLVNTAGGVAGQTMRPVEEVSDADWRVIFAINLDGAFHFTRAVTPAMKRQGGGAIVNISSGAGRSYSLTGIQAYASAKAGLIGFTRQTARELGAARHPRQLHRPGLHPLEPRLRGPVARHGRGRPARPRRVDRAAPPRHARRTSPAPCASSRPTTRRGSPARPSAWTAATGCCPEPSTPAEGDANADDPTARPSSSPP